MNNLPSANVVDQTPETGKSPTVLEAMFSDVLKRLESIPNGTESDTPTTTFLGLRDRFEMRKSDQGGIDVTVRFGEEALFIGQKNEVFAPLRVQEMRLHHHSGEEGVLMEVVFGDGSHEILDSKTGDIDPFFLKQMHARMILELVTVAPFLDHQPPDGNGVEGAAARFLSKVRKVLALDDTLANEIKEARYYETLKQVEDAFKSRLKACDLAGNTAVYDLEVELSEIQLESLSNGVGVLQDKDHILDTIQAHLEGRSRAAFQQAECQWFVDDLVQTHDNGLSLRIHRIDFRFNETNLALSDARVDLGNERVVARSGRYYGWSDSGPRSENQDALLAMPSRGLFAVADGVGGLPKGAVAATIALRMLMRNPDPRLPSFKILQAIQKTLGILTDPEAEKHSGTTVAWLRERSDDRAAAEAKVSVEAITLGDSPILIFNPETGEVYYESIPSNEAGDWIEAGENKKIAAFVEKAIAHGLVSENIREHPELHAEALSLLADLPIFALYGGANTNTLEHVKQSTVTCPRGSVALLMSDGARKLATRHEITRCFKRGGFEVGMKRYERLIRKRQRNLMSSQDRQRRGESSPFIRAGLGMDTGGKPIQIALCGVKIKLNEPPFEKIHPPFDNDTALGVCLGAILPADNPSPSTP